MLGTFYLATYKEQYKLPHKTRHKTAGESPHSLPPNVIYLKWYFSVEIARELAVHQFISLFLGNLRGVRKSQSAPILNLL